MKKILILSLLIFLAVEGNLHSSSAQSKKYTYTIGTEFPEKLSDDLRKKANELGGFVIFFDGLKIILRVPISQAQTMIDMIQNSAFVYDIRIKSKNLTEDILNKQVELKVKRDLLKNLFTMFARANKDEVLDVEVKIGEFIFEVETLKGGIRYLKNDIRNALFDIHVNVNRGSLPLESQHYSNFSWINDLGIKNLLEN